MRQASTPLVKGSVTAAITASTGWDRNHCSEVQADPSPRSHNRLTAPFWEETRWQGMMAPKQRSFLTCAQGRRVGWERERIYLNQLALKLWAAFQIRDLFSSQGSSSSLVSRVLSSLKMVSKCQNPQNKPWQHRYLRICDVMMPSMHPVNKLF